MSPRVIVTGNIFNILFVKLEDYYSVRNKLNLEDVHKISLA